MLKIHSISETSFSNLTFSLTDRKTKMNVVLMTFNLTDEQFLRQFNSHVLRRLKKIKFENIEETSLEKTMQKFFVELNWQLFSKFSRLDDNYETGLSIVLIVSLNNDIYMVQFGRMLCGILHKSDFEYVGKSWDNFKIKTKEELFLLGSRDEDIFVKIHRTEIDDNSLFIALPSIIVEDFKRNMDCANLRRRIRYLYRKQKFPYVILSTRGFKITPKESILTKFWHRLWKK